MIGKDELICNSCIKKISYVKEPKCKKCGKPVIREETEYCEDCIKNTHLYNCGISAFEYTYEIRKAIYKFKYSNRRDYADFFAKAIYVYYEKEIKSWDAQVIIPVPVHYKRKIKRGYNQAEILSKRLSYHLKLPVDRNILIRNINTKPQKELTIKERRQNLENAFKIRENIVKYKKVILVDDIYTTGSTIDACAKVLLAGGTENIYFVSLCIGAGI